AHHLDGGHGVDDELGELRLGLGGGAEGHAAAHRLLDGADDARVGVAEDQRPPRADVVEVLVAVEVVEVRPVAAGDEQRLAADGAERAGGAVDAAGDEATGALEGVPAANAGGLHGWIVLVMRARRRGLFYEHAAPRRKTSEPEASAKETASFADASG